MPSEAALKKLKTYFEIPKQNWQYLPIGAYVRFLKTDGTLAIGGRVMKIFATKESATILVIRGVGGPSFNLDSTSPNIARLYVKRSANLGIGPELAVHTDAAPPTASTEILLKKIKELETKLKHKKK
jgi:hypothetical protein